MAPKPQHAIRALKNAQAVAGYLEYKPGPGIYSRLERAVQQLPENVRVQELPGLLKRYKDGIPGWELKAVDLDSVVAGRDVVPRDELLTAVRERSPVFTHGEVVLGGRPIQQTKTDYTPEQLEWLRNEYPNREWSAREYKRPLLDNEPLPIGRHDSASHGNTKYEDYGQGGDNYTEVLLTQPGAGAAEYGNHWGNLDVEGAKDAVAHLRFDTHGDALRINELQSDLGIHNRRLRERAAESALTKPGSDAELISMKDRRMPDAAYVNFMRSQYGVNVSKKEDGSWVVDSVSAGEPFQLEDSWADILTKRAVLEAARQGHRAIEVASPRAIADKVGGDIDKYQHFYGKVVPGSLERLGRKMGGLREELVAEKPTADILEDDLWKTTPEGRAATNAFNEMERIRADLNERYPSASQFGRRGIGETVERIVMGEPWRSDIHHRDALAVRDVLWWDYENKGLPEDAARQMADKEAGAVIREMQRMQDLARLNHETTRQIAAKAVNSAVESRSASPAGKRYIISDEMRKRIINEGIPAAIAIGTATGATLGGEKKAQAADPIPNNIAFLRSALPKNAAKQYQKLDAQVEKAYAAGDYAKAEALDAQREQMLEDFDNRLAGMDESEGFTDYEPEGVDYTREQSWTMQLGEQYGRLMAGMEGRGPMQGGDGSVAEMADVLRGVFPDTEKARQIPDNDLIAFAKQAFDEREAIKDKMRNPSPTFGIRSLRLSGPPLQNDGGSIVTSGVNPIQAPVRNDQEARAEAKRAAPQFQKLGEQYREAMGLAASSNTGRRPEVRPDFSMEISPDERAAYQFDAKNAGPNPDHDQFRANVDVALDTPSIRVSAMRDPEVGGMMAPEDVAEDAMITPRQYLENWAWQRAYATGERQQELMNDVVANLKGDLAGEASPRTQFATNSLLGAMQASAPGGKYAKNEPVTEQQLAEWRQQYGDQADSMLSPGSAEDFQAQAAYELLRTMQDGEHAPSYANSLSAATNFLAGGGTPRADELYTGPAIPARAKEANKFWAAATSQPADRPPAFRDASGNPLYSDWDTRTLTGLMKAGGDTSTWQGQLTMPMYRFASEWNRNPIGRFMEIGNDEEWAKATGGQPWSLSAHLEKAIEPFSTTMNRDYHMERTQPILKQGMSPEEFRQQIALNKQDAEKRESWESSFYPNVQAAWDKATGQQTPRTWGTPLYESAMKLPRQTFENPIAAGIVAGSAGLGAAGGLVSGAAQRGAMGAARGAARGLMTGAQRGAISQVADLPSDFAQDQLVTLPILGSNWLNAMTTPYADNALMGDTDPNDPNLDQKRQAAEQQRQEDWYRGMQEWNRKRPQTPEEQEYEQWRATQKPADIAGR